MKTRNYILLGITAVLLCIAGGVVGATFSRYTSTASATPTAKVAKWAVKVDEVDISNGKPKSFSPQITWEPTENVTQGYFAPGMTGTVTFKISAEGTQVPVDYEIKINQESISNYVQISIDSVTSTVDNGNATPLEGAGPYKGSIALGDVSKPVTITVNLKWEDADNTNQSDTEIGSKAPILNLPLTVTASQHIA